MGCVSKRKILHGFFAKVVMKQDWCNIPVSVPWRSSGNYRDMQIWLIDNLDLLDWDLDGVDMNDLNRRIVRFARQKDAVLFSLRWA